MALLEIDQDIDDTLTPICKVISTLEETKSILSSEYPLKILHLNIRSIQCNFNQFLIMLRRIDLEFEILVLTECWLTEHSIIGIIDGYTSFRTHNYINRAGGVVVYVKTSWNAIATEPPLEDSNSLVVEIPNILTLIGIYRTPSIKDLNPFLDSLDSILKNYSNHKNFILAGDINTNIMPEAASEKTLDYISLLSDHGLSAVIDKPTHIHTCLDHIFSRTPQTPIGIICNSSTTDHDVVMVGIPHDISKKLPAANNY